MIVHPPERLIHDEPLNRGCKPVLTAQFTERDEFWIVFCHAELSVEKNSTILI